MWRNIANLLAGLVALVNKFVPSREEKAGRAMAERDQLQETLDSVEQAKKSRDRLRDNPGARKRLRDKYTRR